MQVLACDVLDLRSCSDLPEKIFTYHAFFTKLIIHAQVSHLVLETPFLGKNALNFLKLGYLRGITYLLAHTHHVSITEYAPREIKRAVTGYGGAQKPQVATVLHSLFPRLPIQKHLDATDALAAALCCLWKQRLDRLK